MEKKHVAVLSSDRLPAFLGADHPNEEALFAEDLELIEHLASQGVDARRLSWRDEAQNWAQFDAVIIRSTWDYIDDLPAFLEALSKIDASGTRLINSRRAVEWNLDKRYLQDLARAGSPVIPTFFYTGAPDRNADLIAWLAGKGKLVVKPTIGVGGFGLRIYDTPEAFLADDHAGGAEQTFMVQPYLPAIATEGEWSFVFAAGTLAYAVLKTPKPDDFRVQVMYGATTVEKQPSPRDCAAAEAVYRALPVRAELARIDMVRTDGELVVMETELIEPQLYLFDVPDAAPRLARALNRTLRA